MRNSYTEGKSPFLFCLSLLLIMLFSGSPCSGRHEIAFDGVIIDMDGIGNRIKALSGNMETAIGITGKTHFISDGKSIPAESVMPGDRLETRIPLPGGRIQQAKIHSGYSAGEIIFISAEKILTGEGKQIYYADHVKFYINGRKCDWKDLKKGNRAFIRTNPETGLAGTLYVTDFSDPVLTESGPGKISAITPPGKPAYNRGQILKIGVKATPGKKMFADIAGIAMEIPLKETAPGHYSGLFTFTRENIRRTYILLYFMENGVKKGFRVCPAGFDVATDPPEIELKYPEPSKTAGAGNFELFATLSSRGSLIRPDSINVRIDGRSITGGLLKNVDFVSCSVKNLKPGSHSVTITAGDMAGNTSEKSYRFNVKK